MTILSQVYLWTGISALEFGSNLDPDESGVQIHIRTSDPDQILLGRSICGLRLLLLLLLSVNFICFPASSGMYLVFCFNTSRPIGSVGNEVHCDELYSP